MNGKTYIFRIILAQAGILTIVPVFIYRTGAISFTAAAIIASALILSAVAMIALWKLLVKDPARSLANKIRALREGLGETIPAGATGGGFAEIEEGVNKMTAVIHEMKRLLHEQKAAVARSEERFRIMIETLPECVKLVSPDGTIRKINKAGIEMFEADSPELVEGRLMTQFVSPEYRSVMMDYYERALNGGSGSLEFEMIGLKGGRRRVECKAALLRNKQEGVSTLLAITRDITSRKLMEEKLKETNETLQALIKASPLAVVSFDLDGMVRVWNPAAERIFGWSEQEVQGRYNPLVRPEQRNEFLHLMSQVSQGKTLANVELVWHRKNGSKVSVSASSAPIRNRNNEISGMLTVIDDVSERKRAEAEIRRQYDTQTAINWILHISLENMPLENILKQTLDLILSIPWLSFESRGAIFLVEQEPELLVMKAERGLAAEIRQTCGTVPFGKCLCGRAAITGEAQFAGRTDRRHEISYDEMRPHGHYCVPIKFGRRVLGVINIYLKEGHARADKEIEFLKAIGNALAGVIRRSRAEAALQESEKRYRTLAEAAHDMIFIVDCEGRIDYMNSCGADMFRLSSQELIGKSLMEFLPPENAERQRVTLSNVFATGQSLYVENPFSSEIWLGTWLVPLKDEKGKVGTVLGVARGITERIRSEQERDALIHDLQNAFNMISRSQKEWQDTFDSITDMIAIIDNNFVILKANKTFARYFGRHPKDVVNARCHEFCHGTDESMAGCPHQTTTAEKRACSGEVTDKRIGRIISITTFPYLSPNGNCLGSIHVSRDVTDEKEREMRLIMSERLAALGQMASGIAHEINNPLASIAGCSEGLLSRIQKGQYDFKLFETYLNIIQEEIFRCKGITTAMLSFVRKKTYEKKAVDITVLLNRTVEIISFQGRLKGITIERKFRPGMHPVQANEGELRQVFLAVLVNALDAMEDRGTLSLETDTSETEAVVRIGDTGPGISQEDLAKIFDPFFTTKAEQNGTGLGLSIARKIIHNHNGHVEAASEPGKGSVFTIRLPL